MKKILKYVIVDIVQNKIVLIYTFLLLLIALSVFNLESNSAKGLLSLLNIILILVPLISIIFSTIYIYNSSEFIELLVSQPVKRKSIWLSLFGGLASSLSLAFFIGAGIPILLYHADATGITMILTGLFLTVVFVSIAMLAAGITRDKAKGIGLSILLWLYFSLIFDALVLFFLFQFQDYPLERAMVFFSFLNPIDLGRIQILLQMDISALMGYTGAIFREFFGNYIGVSLSFLGLLIWIVVPLMWSLKKFSKKDL
ncbi:ABC transporter permease subunit [Pedobacter nutrimenti]|uniref:Cu-processing system permease protein n=1 Tax=Pedobacter nutrimenti TaxID=1241337 RepID=A0A318U8K2_9SPHI|nr:ABC transporter permease subunit [Pedobacter nutrimenti]PYF70610.1 Cu-processing system permease protein [Pedobacter nutrimenti]